MKEISAVFNEFCLDIEGRIVSMEKRIEKLNMKSDISELRDVLAEMRKSLSSFSSDMKGKVAQMETLMKTFNGSSVIVKTSTSSEVKKNEKSQTPVFAASVSEAKMTSEDLAISQEGSVSGIYNSEIKIGDNSLVQSKEKSHNVPATLSSSATVLNEEEEEEEEEEEDKEEPLTLDAENMKLKQELLDAQEALKQQRATKNKVLSKIMEEFEEVKEKLRQAGKSLDISKTEIFERDKTIRKLEQQLRQLQLQQQQQQQQQKSSSTNDLILRGYNTGSELINNQNNSQNNNQNNNTNISSNISNNKGISSNNISTTMSSPSIPTMFNKYEN